MKYSWTQTGWGSDNSPNKHRAQVINILVALDMMEVDVYNNDYTLATEMLDAIGIRQY